MDGGGLGIREVQPIADEPEPEPEPQLDTGVPPVVRMLVAEGVPDATKPHDPADTAKLSPPEEIRDALRDAISKGVPMWNSGDYAGCAAVYLSAASRYAHADEGLARAVRQCEGKSAESTARDGQGWTLRNAVDETIRKIEEAIDRDHERKRKIEDDRRSSIFGTGLSIDALKALVRGMPDLGIAPAEGDIGECWRETWAHATLPSDWKLEVTAGEGDVTWMKAPGESDEHGTYARRRKYIYRSSSGEEQVDEAPSGSKTVTQLLVDSSSSSSHTADFVGKPTHLVSFPWRMQFRDIVAALENALSEFTQASQGGTAYLWMDVLALGYHNSPGVDAVTLVDVAHNDPSGYFSIPSSEPSPSSEESSGGGGKTFAGFYSVDDAVQSIGRVVQVLDAWDDPRHLSSLWMMRECFSAIANHKPLTYAMSPHAQRDLATRLKDDGPDGILECLMLLELDPEQAFVSFLADRSLLIAEMQKDAQRYAGSLVGAEESMTLMKERVADLTRKAYAETVDQEFWRQWDDLQHELSNGGVSSRWSSVLDLGHQVAALWASADEVRAKKIYEKLITIMKQNASKMQKFAESNSNSACKVAALDRTCAALVQLSSLDDAETREIQKDALGGELAVSFQGLSVEFMARFVDEHDTELNFISTDAVVERVIKPASKRASVIGPTGMGRAFIETVHDEWKGPPTFFLSHAWRQTFHVSGCPWRGGAVQAMVHSVVCNSCAAHKAAKNAQSMLHYYTIGEDITIEAAEPQIIHHYSENPAHCRDCSVKRKNTYVWYDIFCVNQHDTAHAFAFEPLRNAIVQADHVEMFLETWDDPATLSRVWCLEELRVAMLLGKEVKITMPQQAMDSFRHRAEIDSAKMIRDIDRAVQRISIEHASATRDSDRQQVFNNIDESVGRPALNQFARQIMRKALLQAAFPMGLPGDLAVIEQKQSREKQAQIYEGILDIAMPKDPGVWYTELAAMKPRALEKKAIEMGVDANAIEEADDAADTKAEVIRLVLDWLENAPQVKTAQQIRIRRAVAMMQLRDDPNSDTFQVGKRDLKYVEKLARRYYGSGSQDLLDVTTQLRKLDDPWHMILLNHTRRERIGKYAVGRPVIANDPYGRTLSEAIEAYESGASAALAGVDTVTGAQVCCRIPERESQLDLQDKGGLEGLLRTFLVHAQLKHANILKLKDLVYEKPTRQSSSDPRYLIAITEALPGGSLFDEVVGKGGLSEDKARLYFCQILQAMAYLHARRLVHRTIDLTQILLSDDKRTVKVAGLDFVRHEDDDRLAMIQDVTEMDWNYTAPEMLFGGNVPTSDGDVFKSDIWSCGVCLFCMTECRYPFINQTNSKDGEHRLVKDIQSANYRLKLGRSPEYVAFLKRLLCPDLGQRYTAAEALVDPWILGQDWTAASVGATLQAMDSSPVVTRVIPKYVARQQSESRRRKYADVEDSSPHIMFGLWRTCIHALLEGETFAVDDHEAESMGWHGWEENDDMPSDDEEDRF